MVFIPIKWIPWLLIAGGIGSLFGYFDSGESSLLAAFFILGGGGGVWAFFQIKNRKYSKAATDATQNPAMTSEATDSKATFCKSCGTAYEPDAIFCEKCGARRAGA